MRLPSSSKTPSTSIRPPPAAQHRSPTRPTSRATHRSRSFSQDLLPSMEEGRPQNPRNASQLSIPVSAIVSPHIASAHDSRSYPMRDPSLRHHSSYSSHRQTPVPVREQWSFREALGVFQVQCFILGFILPPLWLVGGFWAIEDKAPPRGEKSVESHATARAIVQAEAEWRCKFYITILQAI